MKGMSSTLMGSLTMIYAPLAQAVTLIQDSFETLAADGTLNGREPDLSLAGGTWLTNSVNFKGDGDGGMKVVYTASRSISIDLGDGYLTTNPGVYELSMSLKSHDASSNSWVGIGFTEQAGASTSLATAENAAQAWVMMRQSGSVHVYAGPGTGGALTSGTDLPSVSTSSSLVHTFTLVLDTSLPQWTLQMLLDGTAVDLGSTGNKTYTFGGELAGLRYLMIGASQGGVASPTGTAIIDNFSFSGPEPIPEPTSAALIALSTLACTFRKRCA
jgi:hypothetical protein